MKRLPYAALLLALAVSAQPLFAADAVETRGTIDAVTVYRGQALVTRLVDIAGPAGLKEITVTNLPDQIQPGTIYAESADGVEVRSVSYSAHPVEKDVREEVQKFDAQIRALSDKLTAAQRHRQVLEAQKEYLGRLEQFSAATGNAELSKGVLNADTLQKITQYQFEQRSRIAEDDLKTDLEMRDLNEQLATLQRQRSQVAGSSSKIAREAKVFVNVAGNAGKVRLRYVVDQATWMPSYNVRIDNARDRITVEYLASIQQLSGEDWGNVQMTLSTATPSLVAKAPVLNELAINLARPGQGQTDFLSEIEKSGGSDAARSELANQRQQIEQFRSTIGGNSSGMGMPQAAATRPVMQQQAAITNSVVINGNVVNLDYIGDNNDIDLYLNKTAGDLQLVDLLAREKITRPKDPKSMRTFDEDLAITYQLANRTSLLSRSDRQLIQIATIPLKADFYKVASPVLASAVYDEASATNTSDFVLLTGEYATYVNNQFVGRGVLPSVAVGQSLGVGLGIDSSLRARRMLVEKNESSQGGNRVVDFTYRMSLENFGSKPAKVRLLDRLPTAKETEIRVTRTSLGKDLSKDPLYAETDDKKGILRWDLEVPAQSVDNKALAFEYQFRLEYEKTLSITVPATPAAPAGGGRGGAGGGFGAGGRGALPGTNR